SLAILASFFQASGNRLRVYVAPVPRAASVDNGATIGEIFDRPALWFDPRVERRTPSVGNNVDRGGWIGPRAHRPDQLLEIRNVDIIIGHDDVAPRIGRKMTLTRYVTGLSGMATVALLN